ncbi:MAG: SidA/IucD/PvdA family monooxygenase [Acetobacteraceae bacterium]|nr:SidA/IucD/PvdA family monooxygenase [Acetobacteraceae bacterium]
MTAVLDIAGIGIGPANLSLAALCAEAGGSVNARFFDRKPAFSWHRGMMLPGARLQCSWIKDLVTPVAPVSRFGFLSYLADRGRLFAFVNAGFDAVSREEFADYLSWAAGRLPSLRWNREVRRVSFDAGSFAVLAGNELVHARHLVVGVGHRPWLPPCLEPSRGATCLHSSEFMERTPRLDGRRVAVIGGGQSGAEIALHAFRAAGGGTPASVAWISRRSNFLPLDETHFTNEHFTPAYADHFFRLPAERRERLLRDQRMMSDGISPSTLRDLYEAVYRLRFLQRGAPEPRLLPGRALVACGTAGNAFSLTVQEEDTGLRETLTADVVVAATGYRMALPSCLDSLGIALGPETGAPRLGRRYAAAWDGPPGNRVYVQNAGRASHGIADPQLALLAWRSAAILNDVLGRPAFATGQEGSLIEWSRDGDAI